MAKAKKVATRAKKKPIEQYDHKGKKRVNNPPVGLVTPATDKESGKKTYAYDPHLDPQLVWAGRQDQAWVFGRVGQGRERAWRVREVDVAVSMQPGDVVAILEQSASG